MHEIEPASFCTIKEYMRFLEKRILPSDISLGSLYLVLADIRAKRQEKQAFKFPVRAKAVGETGLAAVNITVDLLDLDLQPVQQIGFVMKDGIVRSPDIKEVSTDQRVREMYLRDYDGFLDIGPSEADIRQEIHLPELVTA